MRHMPMVLLCVAATALSGSGWAQQRSSREIRELASQAAIIFRGTVESVRVEARAAPDEVGRVRVVFRVEDGVRGVKSGELLTIYEWAPHATDYRAGERLVLLLHAPSALGLTSPVGGRAGHLRDDEISREELNAFREAPLSRPERPHRGTLSTGGAAQ